MNRHTTGRFWETVARDYLENCGFITLKERYRCRLGELDLVCRDGGTIVVVEVRARGSSSFASANDSVDCHKQRRIILATRHLLMCNPDWNAQPLRFDVFAISDIDSKAPRIQWTRNAFDAS